MHLTLRQMQVFEAVVRNHGVTAAARELHCTQPNVSIQLKQLADQVGMPLFDHARGRLHLTEAGEALYRTCQSVRAALQDFETGIANLQGLQRGKLRIGVVSTAKYFVPMLLVRFGKLNPGIHVQLSIDNREHVLGLLARSEADLVIMGRSPSHLNCQATAFATNPLAMVAPPDHPLVRRKNLPFSALADYEFVVREEGSGTRAAMQRLFEDNKTPLQVVMAMPSNETIKQAVMAGMGLSFLSLRTVRHELASGHLAMLDVQGLPQINNWFVTHLKEKKLSPAARAFKEFLIEQGGALMDTWS